MSEWIGIVYIVGVWFVAAAVGYRTSPANRNFTSLKRLIVVSLFWPLTLAAGLGAAIRGDDDTLPRSPPPAPSTWSK